jgi:hypothetical protein
VEAVSEAQEAARRLIWGTLWDPPCQHLGREWTIDTDGTAHCTMCPATWTLEDEREREARKAAGAPPGESDRDRFWREFREMTWAARPLIMRLPPGEHDANRP